VTPATLDMFLKERPTLPRDIKAITDALGSAPTGITVQAGDTVRVRTTIAFDNGRRAATEAVILLDSGDNPYRILSWRDEAEIATLRRRN
jgi:general secretion pathway protein K